VTDSLFTSQTPALPENHDGPAINVGLTFTVATTRSCSGGRFYGPTTITGTVDMTLYEVTAADTPGPGAGTALAAAASPDWSASQMQAFVKGKMKEMGFPGFLAGLFTKGIPKPFPIQARCGYYLFGN